jgi:hypothetical protein
LCEEKKNACIVRNNRYGEAELKEIERVGQSVSVPVGEDWRWREAVSDLGFSCVGLLYSAGVRVLVCGSFAR